MSIGFARILPKYGRKSRELLAALPIQVAEEAYQMLDASNLLARNFVPA